LGGRSRIPAGQLRRGARTARPRRTTIARLAATAADLAPREPRHAMTTLEHVPSGWFVVRAPYLSLDERVAAPSPTVEDAMHRGALRDHTRLAFTALATGATRFPSLRPGCSSNGIAVPRAPRRTVHGRCSRSGAISIGWPPGAR